MPRVNYKCPNCGFCGYIGLSFKIIGEVSGNAKKNGYIYKCFYCKDTFYTRKKLIKVQVAKRTAVLLATS